MKRLLILSWIATAAVTLTLSQEKIDQRRPASADASISIENIAGKVDVAGWDREEVEITGTLGAGTEGLEVTGDRDHVTVKVKYPRSEGRHSDVGATLLALHVPKGAKLSVETVSAEIAVSEFEGETELQSVSGTVHVTGSPKTADLSTASGAIAVDAKSQLADGYFETVSGNVVINVPRGTSADFEAASFSGSIENNFGEKAKKTNPYLPSSELNFQVGGGGARVTLQTLSGRIRIAQQ